ncbi:uncharacterized protein adgrg2a isoform X2 [Sander vitreus]
MLRRMHGLCFKGCWRWTHHFLLVIWLSLMTATPPKALGYFLGDTKAVLNGCEDHWTLQDRATMPLLLQMTLCVDIRVVVPGAWVAFSYSSVLAPGPELGLEGDDEALYGWLLMVRHRFPMRLSPTHWHRVCLRRDVSRNSFSLEVDGKMLAERTVIARAIPPNGSLWLGCRPRDRPPGAILGQVELYLFRMWADLGNHGLCEDGTVIGWNAQSWGLTSPKAAQRDKNLLCVDRRQLRRGARAYRSVTDALPTGFERLFSPLLEVPSTTTTTSSVMATPVTHMSNQTSKATVSTPPGSTTVNSNQTEPPFVTPSANHSTEKKPSNFQNSSVTPSTNGIPLSILTPVNQTTASNTALPFTAVPVSGASSAYQMSASTQTSLITSLLVKKTTPGRTLPSGSTLVNCNISQLCSNTNAYFWMSISVAAQGDNKTEQDVHNLVSNAFSCHSNATHGVTGFIDFCQGDRQLQAVQVNCNAKSNIRQTTCNVLLQLSHAVSACELQRAGVSALQQAGDQQIQARIIGKVERVGRDVCGDVEPSSGVFVRCTSTSSLEEICQANNHSMLTCSLIEPDSNPAPQPNTESCSSEAPRFCDCTAFCNSASQFFAMRININSASFNVNSLKVLLSGLSAARACNTMSGSVCQDISKLYQRAHLECHGTPRRLYSCMVILEMSGPVNGCALNILLQQVINNNSGITSETPLTRMVVCGPPGLAVSTLLISNLTWVASDLLTSDVCQPDPTLLKCEANESLAVLLTDSCPPEPSTTKQSTTQPSNLTDSTTTPKALKPSVTNTTVAQNTATVQKTNASQGTAQPNMTTPLTTINSTQSSAAQPVLQTSSQNTTVTVSNSTIVQNTTSSNNTTLLTPTENTKLLNTTTAHHNTTEFTTLASVNSTLQMATALIVSKLNTTTLSPNHTAEYNVATVGTVIHSNNHTTVYNVTTVSPSTNHTTVYNVTTVSPSTNHTTVYNVTTVPHSTNHTTVYNVTTVPSRTNHTTVYNVTTVPHSTNHTTVYNVTTVGAFTPSTNDTTLYNVTTVPPSTNHTKVYNVTTITPSLNGTTAYNVTTPGRFTPSTNHTPEYNVTTVPHSTNHTTVYNVTTIRSSPNDTTMYNVTTVPPSTNHTKVYNITTITPSLNGTTAYNVTTPGRFTPSTNHTPEYNVTTVPNSTNHTTVYNVTTVPSRTNHTTVYNVTTVPHSTNHTTVYNVTTVPSRTNHTTVYNVTTVPHSTNHTTAYHVTTITPSLNGTTAYNVTTPGRFTPSTNHTPEYNVTTVPHSTNHTTVYNVTTIRSSPNDTTMYNVTTVPPSTNHTKVYNITTITPSLNGTTAYNVTTPGRFTPSTNHTPEYNVTTVPNSTNHTTVYNVTTVPSRTNHTTVYNVTTVPSRTNHTTVYNVTTVPHSTNHTTAYHVTTITPSLNGTTAYNVTTPGRFTPSTNHTSEYNVTSADRNGKENSTFTTNTTVSTFTTSPNHTVVYNVTMATKNYTTPSNNYTTEYNITTADSNMNLHNGTITTSNATIRTFTASPNHTTVNNVTTLSNNYTTLENINTTTVSQNKTATDNVTTAPIRETQQNTTAPYKNTTMSTTVKHVNGTTTTKNSTADNVTSVVDNTTKPTVAPLINLNQTAGISFNLSSTVSSLTFNLTTKGPEVNLTTTAANASLEATTSTTTTTTVHGTLPAQINTTTAKVTSTSSTTLQTTTITNTTTAKPGSTSTTIAETTTSQTAQEEQANELLNQTQDASQLNSSQVAQLVRKLEKLLDGPTVSQAVGQKMVNIISNLMKADSLALSASANRLVHLVDDMGLKLVVTGDREILSSGSLVLAVRTIDGTNFPTTSVDIFNTDNVQLRALSRSRSKRSGSALGSVFLPSSLTSGLSPEQQKQANRVQFTFYTKSVLFQDASLDNKTLVSPVLAASVTNLSISNLSENIQFTIRNINPVHANYAASCAFWDFTRNAGGGGWSSAGCFVVNSTQEETTCSCNHLTSFAILLDLSREGIIDRKQAQILTFITYIGCGISAIFLALTLLTYLLFEKLLRDIPAKILVQLCLSLLLLNLVFLLDGWLALYPAVGLCISTAFFLHYFLLTSFTWAGLEALHMYLSIVRVFTPYLSRYMLKFSMIGWGLPLLVVIVVISVDKNNYGLVTYGKYTDGTSDDFCWLRNDIAFYVGVVAYFLLIFALCLLVFIVVMVQLSRIKKQNPQNQPPNRGVMTDLRSIAGLIILLGLTWGFSLFAWGPLYLPFVYLFTICNSLQGFLVFVFHCAVKENVRRQWRTYLCCGSLRLAENSDWSRTATQNNRNMLVTTATISAPHFTSRSSSVISNVTNSSSSVFWDSGIYDGSNSDAHLNEIHRQTLSL